MRLALLALSLAAGCGSDPCGGIEGAPSIEIGGADFAGQRFEPFADGEARDLVRGPQGGMHVWMHARMENVCPETAVLERRAVDDETGAVYFFSRSPLEWIPLDDGRYELPGAEAMILCPPALDMPVVDHPLRFVATVTDDALRHAEAELSFLPRCPAGMDCAPLCGP
jgi:hypothetical protein